MDFGWLSHLVVLVIGIAIGVFYGSWVTDEWWKELKK